MPDDVMADGMYRLRTLHASWHVLVVSGQVRAVSKRQGRFLVGMTAGELVSYVKHKGGHIARDERETP